LEIEIIRQIAVVQDVADKFAGNYPESFRDAPRRAARRDSSETREKIDNRVYSWVKRRLGIDNL